MPLLDPQCRSLPPGYFAEIQVTPGGGRVEVDVPTLERPAYGARSTTGGLSVGVAALTASAWAPPAPAFEMPAGTP